MVDVAVGIGVLVGGTGVFVGGMGVCVGGNGVFVGGMGVLVGGLGVCVGGGGFGVFVGGGGSGVFVAVGGGGSGVFVAVGGGGGTGVSVGGGGGGVSVGGGGGVSVGGGGGGGVSVGNGSICAMLIERDEADWAVTAARAGADERTGTSDTSVTRTTSNVRDRILGMGTAFAGAVTGQEGSPATASRIHGTASAVCGRRHLIPPCRAFSIANMSMGVCALSNATRRASWIGRYCLEC